jgi:phage replication O-like protein O
MKRTGNPNRGGHSNLGIEPPKRRTPKEVAYFTGIVMMNDFIDNDMPHLKPAEIKLALVIFRKTIGWNKFSDEIGTTQLCKLAKLDKDTVKDTVRHVCEKVGIRIDQRCERGVLSRRRYTWPLNERVAAILDKARRGWEVGGKLPPRLGG